MRSTLSHLTKEKGSSFPRDGCFKCGGAHFQRDCNTRKGKGKQTLGRANRASHGPRVSAKERMKRSRVNPKEHPNVPKVSKVRTRVKPRKLVYQVLKTRNQRHALRNSGICTDWSSVGWHAGWDQTYDTSASSCSLGSLDVCATSGPKRFEWVKMNLGTEAAVNTFPSNFGPEGAGDGRFYRTASG